MQDDFYSSKKYEKLQKKKRVLRRRAMADRKTKDFTQEDESISLFLCDFFLQSPRDSIICSYLSMPDEFPTVPLLEKLHKERPDLQFYVPRIESRVRDGAKMHFYPLTFDEQGIIWSALEEDSRGIMQPQEKEDKLRVKKIKDKEISLYFIMPGLYFDKIGYRLGYGGGYYDRYLNRHPADRILLAPCRALQYLDEKLPHSERDVPVDLLIMADGIRLMNKDLDLPKKQKKLLNKG